MARRKQISPKPYLRSVELKRDLVPSFDEYPFSVPVIRNLEKIEFHPDVTFIIGENGTGKSTLIEGIATKIGFDPGGGTKNITSTGVTDDHALRNYLALTQSHKRPGDFFFLRAESFHHVATFYDENIGTLKAFGHRPIHARSHGEQFFDLLTAKISGNGLYLFDEPEAALSPSRQLAALKALDDLVKEHSQFIIATHSPILMAYPRAKILQINDGQLEEISYEETEHYHVTRDFLNRHERMLQMILGELGFAD